MCLLFMQGVGAQVLVQYKSGFSPMEGVHAGEISPLKVNNFPQDLTIKAN
jgi:hypothetical protein